MCLMSHFINDECTTDTECVKSLFKQNISVTFCIKNMQCVQVPFRKKACVPGSPSTHVEPYKSEIEWKEDRSSY
jgi:hypothetical protein